MNVWIDLDNSPHVHFFNPLIRDLEQRGIKYFITLRSFSQTEELARTYGMKYEMIGKHSTPHYFVTRVTATLQRAAQLAAYAVKQKPTVAISHGSRAMAMAAYWMRIPIMTLYDYEFVSCRFFNMVSKKVVVPQTIPVDRLQSQGLNLEKLVQYPGFKEEVYVHDFAPDPSVLTELGLDPNRIIVTVRPPSTWAHYQDPKSAVVLDALMSRLRNREDIQVITITRTAEQADALRAKYGESAPRFQIRSAALDGLSLMWYSDAIFSGGGTMVREAALLGRNAYSIFAGKLGGADAALEEKGLLKMIRSEEELDKIEFRKTVRTDSMPRIVSPTREFVSAAIERFVSEHSEGRAALRPALTGKGSLS
jgi:uncharacterized protein